MGKEVVLLALCLFTGYIDANQELVDNMARYIKLRYYVVDNFVNTWVMFDAKITLTNTGPDIPSGNAVPWSLYFTHTSLIEPNGIRPDGVELADTGLKIHHIAGYLYKIVPLATFAGIATKQKLEVPFSVSGAYASRTMVMPNWYVVAPNAQPRTIQSTAGNSLDFVGAFDTERQYRRSSGDLYKPFTAADRFKMFSYKENRRTKQIMPTPISEDLDASKRMNIRRADWLVVAGSDLIMDEARFLADKLGTNAVAADEAPANQYIRLDLDFSMQTAESYTINFDYDEQTIDVKGSDNAGIFYGIQTILSLAAADGTVPHGQVTDHPRFEYRGLHVDVARNFRPVEDIKRVIEVMSMYKMNKLHLHLCDDEGWRLEVPGLPELTEVAGRRCHDETGQRCLMPQLGSPPGLGHNSGVGYYTVEDYKEILKYANDRHMEVIPEFDMPGHSHAAVNAMLARYRKYQNTDLASAKEFLLSDLDDTSEYLTQQNFADGALNPCLESTYKFVERIVSHIKEIHSTIQPLKVYHFGGDEVPKGAWMKSPACNGKGNSTEVLKEEFVIKLAAIVGKAGLNLAGWEDGFSKHQGSKVVPMDLAQIPVSKVYGYFWDNIWEWGKGDRAYVSANAGYKVILSHATHLYFDHPYEPDPEDRGIFWATRHIDTKRAFSYNAEDVYANIDVGMMGNKLTKTEICSTFPCTVLEPGKKRNIIGMQAQIWTEVTRTSENFDYMLFPRLLALAERSWHKASWESISDETRRNQERDADWLEFAHALGSKELARLDELGIKYAIRPPGARFDKSTTKLEALMIFPGLPIWYSVDNGTSWTEYKAGTKLSDDEVCKKSKMVMVARSADNSRESRQVTVDISGSCTNYRISSGSVPQMSFINLTVILSVITFVLRLNNP